MVDVYDRVTGRNDERKTLETRVAELGVEDAEHPAAVAARHLQRGLSAIVDDFRVAELARSLAATDGPEAWHDERRIADLCDETTPFANLLAMYSCFAAFSRTLELSIPFTTAVEPLV